MRKFKQIITVLLIFCLMLCAVGCNNKSGTSDVGTTSDANILYGDAVDTEDDDDTANASNNSSGTGIVSQSGTTSTNKDGSNGNTSPSNNYKIDEIKKKSFLESVPKSLRGKTVKVLVWWTPGVTETAKAQAFEKTTGIKIKFVQTGLGGEYATKLSALIQQKNSPDLACIVQDYYPGIVMQNNFQTLDAAKLNLSDSIYDIDTMNMFKYKGKYYGAMIKSSTMITFYATFFNRDMFRKYGVKNPEELWKEGNWNWDTFVSMSQEIKNKAKLQSVVSSEYGAHYIVQSAGTDPVKFVNGKIINNSSDSLLETAWQFKNDLTNKYNILGGGQEDFKSGKMPMCIIGNYVAQTGDSFNSGCKFDWGMAPCPSPKGQETIVPSTVKLWGIPRGAKNAEAAGYWLRYWLDESFDPADKPLWANTQVKEVNNWLWEQKKQFTNFMGIINYGANYNWESMVNELSTVASSNIKSILDAWSGTIDKNIQKIEKEFG